jgi:hypothetical protein
MGKFTECNPHELTSTQIVRPGPSIGALLFTSLRSEASPLVVTVTPIAENSGEIKDGKSRMQSYDFLLKRVFCT